MNFVLHNSLRALALAPLTALCLVVAPALATDAPTTPPAATMPHGPMQPTAPGVDAQKKPAMSGMGGMEHMPMSGDADKDFATMMKMHHQHGVDMAQTELANGKSPAMKALATRIIAAQKKEIAQLEQWLAKQK